MRTPRAHQTLGDDRGPPLGLVEPGLAGGPADGSVTLGADGTKYAACIADAKTEEKLQKDMKDGSALGVRGTPAFFLYKMQDGKETGSPTPLSGALPFAQFSQAIDALLK